MNFNCKLWLFGSWPETWNRDSMEIYSWFSQWKLVSGLSYKRLFLKLLIFLVINYDFFALLTFFLALNNNFLCYKLRFLVRNYDLQSIQNSRLFRFRFLTVNRDIFRFKLWFLVINFDSKSWFLALNRDFFFGSWPVDQF